MSETGDIAGLEGVVVPKLKADIVPNASSDTQPLTEMDFDTARTILQTIVKTDEKTFTDQSKFGQIGGYSIEQVRQAEIIITKSIMKKPEA